MPVEAALSGYRSVTPSGPSELAWLLNLLVSTAPYAGPALAELEESILPGAIALQDSIRDRFHDLWDDGVPGCPELVPAAHHAGCLLDGDPSRFLDWLARSTNQPSLQYELLTEPPPLRAAIAIRVERLCTRGALRARYGELLRVLWNAARVPWLREGRRIAEEASAWWLKRLQAGGHVEDLVAPRHPLRRGDLPLVRLSYVVSPLYFCLSGGHAVDVNEYVHIGVPASDLLPIRKVRDAMFVADRLRVLAEPTRVHVLIQVMTAPSGVMELARSLRLSQPTVSGHVKVLRSAGLIHQRTLGSRNVFVASRKRIEQLLDDARETLARWE